MKFKRIVLACFYFVAGFVFTNEVTAFDRLGVTNIGASEAPTPSPNWDTRTGKPGL